MASEGHRRGGSLEDHRRSNGENMALGMPYEGGDNGGRELENRSRVFVISSEARNIVVFEMGSVAGEALVEAWNGNMPQPARVEVINNLLTVAVSEATDCVICLEQVPVGGEVRELPCRHRFHSQCIARWLGIHRSCPVCRYALPAERLSPPVGFRSRLRGSATGPNSGPANEAEGRGHGSGDGMDGQTGGGIA